ncbi:MAG: hypothetical protein CL910_04455 [Deltaproteobacteria bacterium]|nr:hypothetical protein [Deltaproteobacteria bacterium]
MAAGKDLPQALTPLEGPLPASLSRAAAESLGPWGERTRALVAAGRVPADVVTGLTLYLLANQARRPRPTGERPKGAVSGGVWVREQFTVHAPMEIGKPLSLRGESARRFTRRGRRYGVNTSQTRDAKGELLATNCTTGLLRYRKDESLPDGEEGLAESELIAPCPDGSRAADNPSLAALRSLSVGDRFEGEPQRVTLEMMRQRDAGRDDNPIHTDPEVARREGLKAPIAGGSHVLAFGLELLMRAWGSEALLYGSHFDVRWKGQTYAETSVTPFAVVEAVGPEEVAVSLEVRGEERIALVCALRIPLGEAAA